uniref:non-specific serine/threonine protein kinase n=1 Tax=Parascaris univalens TaxID=6257 RepID=A0A915ABQ3_PARUN
MDDYEKIAVVGRGAHGVCWLCRRKDDVFRQTVIVKTVSLDGLTAEEETAIMGEVTLLQRLHHPHIIGYYESFKTENALSIVMQYAEGGTMDKMISDQKGVFFSEQQVLNYFTQVSVGLEYMHSKQILHRDLKTQNILLNKKRTIVKLSDFGISKELSTRSLASTVVGTPNYLSPEICEGRAYNQKSDLWALGCVLYELCELQRAFDGENLPSIVMKITKGKHGPISVHWSAGLKHLIESLLDLNENKRPLLKEILTGPLILPVCLSIHLDLGQLPSAPSRKNRPIGLSNSKVLRTQPVRTRSQIGSID